MRIVDLHHYRGEFIYCGRAIENHATLEAVRVDSPLRNPYKLTREIGRGFPLSRFRQYLMLQINNATPAVMQALDAIKEDSILGCWCINLEGEEVFRANERCHCQIIAKAWRWLQRQRKA